PAHNHRQTTARYRQSPAYEPARVTGDPAPDRTWSNHGAPDRFVFSWSGPPGPDQRGWNAAPVFDWGRSVSDGARLHQRPDRGAGYSRLATLVARCGWRSSSAHSGRGVPDAPGSGVRRRCDRDGKTGLHSWGPLHI